MDTRDHIIQLADELIRTKGYNAFSYGDIAAALGIRNAAIHYHFPLKADLGVTVIDRELERIAKSRVDCSELAGAEQLRRVVDLFYGSSRKGWICLNGSLTPDFVTLPDSVREKVAAMSQAVLEWVTECLEKGRNDGTLRFRGAAGDRALLVVSTLLSSLLLSRVMGSDVFDRMLDMLFGDLEVQ